MLKGRLKFAFKFIMLQAIIVSVAFLCGSFEEVRTDSSGDWCAHFNTFMVCNTPGGTDYVLGE
jgi:hypothetical protein